MDCSICCEGFTKKLRKPIDCSNCDFKACVRCHERFLLDSSAEAKCMNCNRAWNTMFLHSNFTQAFVKRYRRHRTQILWAQQIYQLPFVTDYIAQERLERLKFEEGQRLREQLKRTRAEISKLKYYQTQEARTKRKEQKKLRTTLHAQLLECNGQRWFHASERHRIYRAFVQDTNGEQERRAARRERPCVTEDCKGFVDAEGNCPVCQKMTCLKCNVTKVDDTHVCSQVDVDTWNDLKKNTRPCPNCNTRIFKISGCDQMFCIQCNTAFSWSRGTIEQGAIHNPHYFEWLFQQRGQAAAPAHDPPGNCNEDNLPDFRHVRSRFGNGPDRNDRERDIGELYRKIRHFRYVIMPRFSTSAVEHRRQVFRYLHMYLTNDAKAPKKFEECVQRFETNNEIYEILNSYRRIQTHLFRTFANREINTGAFLNQFHDCKEYYRGIIKTTGKIYKRTIRVDDVFE